jgi:prepilin-type N-terminal cleavage/methylation domain-containing protein
MQKRHQSLGFTIIEVLIAVAISAIGFAAIFSLQIGSMQANIAARDLAAAVNLGERYVEVLHQQSFAWTGAELPEPYLNQAPGAWHTFTENAVDHNARAHQADDLEFGSPLRRQRFCVHYWIDPFDGMYRQLMNGRVRVIWPRTALDPGGLVDVCPENVADDFDDDVREWFSITMPVALRSNEIQ